MFSSIIFRIINTWILIKIHLFQQSFESHVQKVKEALESPEFTPFSANRLFRTSKALRIRYLSNYTLNLTRGYFRKYL